jgi:MFS family permease
VITTIWTVGRVLLMSIIIVVVGQISDRFPRAGALILSLPIVSILAILVTWQQHRNLQPLSTLARETLILVPLGLPFFIPLAFASRLGIGFWAAMVLGTLMASAAIVPYLVFTSSR